MQQNQTKKRWKLPWYRALCIALVVYGLCLFSFHVFTKSKLDRSFSRRIELLVRDYLGRSPKLDPRLKIYAFDDDALQKLRRSDFTMEEWGKLLEAFSKKHPKKIFIDKVFGYSPDEVKGVADFKATLSSIDTPVIASAFWSPHIKGRKDLMLTRGSDYLNNNFVKTSAAVKMVQDIPLGKDYAYGPAEEIVDSFNRIGHIIYVGDGKIKPYKRIDPYHLLPHMGVYAADSIELQENGFVLNGNTVPTDSEGKVHLNLVPMKDFYFNTYSLKKIFDVSEDGKFRVKVSDWIEKDDIILILPMMYTGNTDWKETPLGTMPGGFMSLSFINSVLSNQWIVPVGYDWLFTLLACALAAVFAQVLNIKPFSSALIGGSLVIYVGGLASFAYFSVVLPWLMTLLSFFVCGVAVFAEKMRLFESHAKSMRTNFGKALPDKILDELIHNPEALLLEPSRKQISIMFLDIVGFSNISESQKPDLLFRELRERLNTIVEVVHAHGGVVDKTLGDGLMAFFGYQYNGKTYSHHADRALACAVQIQRANLIANKKSLERSGAIYPLRIGINSSEVYIGNIGDERRVDITLIGDGVNFAQRLESACESHKVLIGNTTKGLLSNKRADDFSIHKRLIPIKHHGVPQEAYECDPMISLEEMLREVITYHRKSMRLKRQDLRWALSQSDSLIVRCEYGEGFIRDFSKSGLSIELDNYLGKGMIVNMSLESADPVFDQLLKQNRFDELVCECRWGFPSGGNKFLHGILIKGHTNEQRERFLNLIRTHFFPSSSDSAA